MEPTLFICTHWRVPTAPCCKVTGPGLLEAITSEVAARNLGWRVVASTCMGHCALGANIKAAPGGPMLHGCKPEKAGEVVDELLRTWTYIAQ